MKKLRQFIASVFVFAFAFICILCVSSTLVSMALGADAAPLAAAADTAATATATAIAPAVPAASSLWLSLIPLGVPVLVMFIKGFIPSLPKPWLPVIAAAVGLALAVFDHFTGSLGGNPVAVLFLGAAGTGLREIGDQLKKVVTA